MHRAQAVGALAPQTGYTFTVTAGVKDVAGFAFAPAQATFTTGARAIDAKSPVRCR